MEWLTVAEISKITRIQPPTARRYASLFKEFLPSKKVGRVTKYSDEAVAVFEKIAHYYSEGHVTTEIEDFLKQDYTRTIDVETSPTPIPDSTGVQISSDIAATFQEMMEKFTSCIEIIADQKSLIESQREDIQKLKTAFVLLARSQKKIKQLPSESMSDVTRSLAAKTIDLERKDKELEEMALGLSFDSSDMKAKLQILESELVRLRKDRREMEKYLQDKIERLKEGSEE